MEILQTKQLTKNYGATPILKGIDLTIHQGEIFGFVGHNGAGKSTFIHTLTGILHKSSGTFNILGASDQQMNQIKPDIGVMPDITNLYNHMKGIQFLRYMGKLTGDKRSRDEYETLMEEVGLENVTKKKIKTYSFGMKKKISIAQALLGNPSFIILDEPTSGLDPESAIHIRRLIKRLQKQGKTILLTSHNLDEIDKISDRVGILSDGVINKLGTPEYLKKDIEAGCRISIRTKPALPEAAVQRLSSKLDISLSYLKEEDAYTQVQIGSEEDIPLLSRELAASDFLIYELKIASRSLEDVFMNT